MEWPVYMISLARRDWVSSFSAYFRSQIFRSSWTLIPKLRSRESLIFQAWEITLKGFGCTAS